MAINPYAQFLHAGDDPFAVMAATPELLSGYLGKIRPERAEQPWMPGKWSIRQVMAHLADCEMAFGFRIRQTLAEPGLKVQAFNQDLYANHYDGYDLKTAQAAFLSMREWNLKLLTTVSAEERSYEMTHPERGTMTLWVFLESIAGHDRNHLLQIEKVAGEQ